MEYKAQFHLSIIENEEIFEVVITGEITRDTINQLHNEMVELLEGVNTKVLLIDLRALKAHQDTFASAYFRARSLPLELAKIHIAIVDPNENAAYISFYETTMANVGLDAKWFTDIEPARAWLRAGHKK